MPGARAGASWGKNQEPEPLGKKQEQEPQKKSSGSSALLQSNPVYLMVLEYSWRMVSESPLPRGSRNTNFLVSIFSRNPP